MYLFWTNKKFVYLIFIGQKISYFCHYVHVRKSPDDMNKSLDTFNNFRLMKMGQGKLNECWVTWPGPDP